MKVLVVAAVIAGCGTDAQKIELAIPGTQVLVTEKVNGGAWKKLSGQFDGDANATTYSIEIGDEYELAVVCIRSGPRDAGQFVAAEVFGTNDDPEVTLGSWKVPNCLLNASGLVDSVDAPIKVSGTFDEDALLSVGRMAPKHIAKDNAFSFTINPGRHDLIAYSNLKMVIQRDLPMEADTTLAPLHIASEGFSVLSAEVSLSPGSDWGLANVSDRVRTANDTFFTWSTEDPAGALFIPTDMLAPGDKQEFFVSWSRRVETMLTIVVDSPVRIGDITLLPEIESAMRHGGGVGMTWTPISDFYTTATISTSTTNGSEQWVTASRQWLARHGEGALDFDFAVDGYDPSWKVPDPLHLMLESWSPGLVSRTGYTPGEAM